jgi:hypothetical protein
MAFQLGLANQHTWIADNLGILLNLSGFGPVCSAFCQFSGQQLRQLFWSLDRILQYPQL